MEAGDLAQTDAPRDERDDMTEWNPSDPDAVRVVYDLAKWTIDQQAELASELADADVPHTWEGSDLVVPEDAEQATDLIIADVEGRLGIVDEELGAEFDGTDDDADDVDDEGVDELELPEPIELATDAPTTEYDLSEWPPTDRMTLTHALTRSEIPFRWEGQNVLLVGTADEAIVDGLLDQIERGEFSDPDAPSSPGSDQLPFETLTTFFLAGERLRRDPLDADGIEQLLAATEVADPQRPPYGVQPRLWIRVCDLADRLSVALVGTGDDDEDDEDETDDATDDATDDGTDGADDTADEDPFDYDLAVDIANQLHDVLRPYV